jgi:hypothetical protein
MLPRDRLAGRPVSVSSRGRAGARPSCTRWRTSGCRSASTRGRRAPGTHGESSPTPACSTWPTSRTRRILDRSRQQRKHDAKPGRMGSRRLQRCRPLGKGPHETSQPLRIGAKRSLCPGGGAARAMRSGPCDNDPMTSPSPHPGPAPRRADWEWPIIRTLPRSSPRALTPRAPPSPGSSGVPAPRSCPRPRSGYSSIWA